MRSALLLAVVLATSCFVASPVVHFGGGKSATESQHDLIGKVTPPGLVTDTEWSGPITTAKIRVLADDEYRAQNLHWQQTFQVELDYANEVLASQFGVRLEAEYRAWNYRAPPGATLEPTLAALAHEDAGTDVLTVIGLTSSLSLVESPYEKIGLATTPGHHLVVRGYADVEERRSFERAFSDLRADERAALYDARRRHKGAALLLHELAHNFGAPHRDESDTIMSPNYSVKSASFDPATHEIILASLETRLHRPSRPSGRHDAVAASPAPPADKHPVLVITVDAAGRRVVGGNVIDDDTLDGLLHLSFDDDRDTSIVVKPAPGAPTAVTTKVLERAKAAGLHRVSVVGGD